MEAVVCTLQMQTERLWCNRMLPPGDDVTATRREISKFYSCKTMASASLRVSHGRSSAVISSLYMLSRHVLYICREVDRGTHASCFATSWKSDRNRSEWTLPLQKDLKRY
jgi:hypothetical protein